MTSSYLTVNFNVLENGAGELINVDELGVCSQQKQRNWSYLVALIRSSNDNGHFIKRRRILIWIPSSFFLIFQNRPELIYCLKEIGWFLLMSWEMWSNHLTSKTISCRTFYVTFMICSIMGQSDKFELSRCNFCLSTKLHTNTPPIRFSYLVAN